jgi:hypothetical protein
MADATTEEFVRENEAVNTVMVLDFLSIGIQVPDTSRPVFTVLGQT